MKLYIAHWFDSTDKLCRVAGVYQHERSAWRRVTRLGSGTVQEVTLNKLVRFTHETRGNRATRTTQPKEDTNGRD
jgi:hypothetical protein